MSEKRPLIQHGGDVRELALGDILLALGGIKIAGGNYFYLRGNATTDGSVRMFSPSEGTLAWEMREGGEWVPIASPDGDYVLKTGDTMTGGLAIQTAPGAYGLRLEKTEGDGFNGVLFVDGSFEHGFEIFSDRATLPNGAVVRVFGIHHLEENWTPVLLNDNGRIDLTPNNGYGLYVNGRLHLSHDDNYLFYDSGSGQHRQYFSGSYVLYRGSSVKFTVGHSTGRLDNLSEFEFRGMDVRLIGGKRFYYRGDANTNGSVRIVSNENQTLDIEYRHNGEWLQALNVNGNDGSPRLTSQTVALDHLTARSPVGMTSDYMLYTDQYGLGMQHGASTNIFELNPSGGAGEHLGTLTHAPLTADREWVLPDKSGTLALAEDVGSSSPTPDTVLVEGELTEVVHLTAEEATAAGWTWIWGGVGGHYWQRLTGVPELSEPTHVRVPDFIDGYPVEETTDLLSGSTDMWQLPANKANLTGITGLNIRKVGGRSFMNCEVMAKCIMPRLEDIGSYAFHTCSALEELNYPRLWRVGANQFANCISLTDVELPSLSEVRDYVFGGCTALRTLTLPKLTGTNNPYAMFWNCPALEWLRIGAYFGIGQRLTFGGTTNPDLLVYYNPGETSFGDVWPATGAEHGRPCAPDFEKWMKHSGNPAEGKVPVRVAGNTYAWGTPWA